MKISVWLGVAGIACGSGLASAQDQIKPAQAAPAAPGAAAEGQHADQPPQPAPATTSRPAGKVIFVMGGSANPPTMPAPAAPADPGAIPVPANTIGPGLPMWLERDLAKAETRRAQADADAAAARADRERTLAQRTAADDDGDTGVVIYGPHSPGLWWALRQRPVAPGRPVGAAVMRDNDPFTEAQFRFFDAARPPVERTVEPQLEAQRRFGESAQPPVSGPQRQRDDAVLKARNPPKPPQ